MRFQNAEQVAVELGFRHPRVSSGTVEMCNVLMANVAAAESDGRSWVHYSRDRNWYAAQRRYLPPACTLKNIVEATSLFELAGIIEHDRVRPSSMNEFRSRYRGLPKLLTAIATSGGQRIEIIHREVLFLRNAEKQNIDYCDTVRTDRMRRDITAQNAFLHDLDIGFDHPKAVRDRHGVFHIGEWSIDTGQRTLVRIFNETWNQGGRWYGGFWQRLPKPIRSSLTINGQATVELDFPALHPRLLMAAAGVLDDPALDPYAIAGVDRSVAKKAVNILLNADTERAAQWALVGKLSAMRLALRHDCARDAISAVRRAMPELTDFWGSGIGRLLQAVDSDIAAGVQRSMRANDVPTLNVYDSFIVPAKAENLLAESMTSRLEKASQTVGFRLKRLVMKTR